MQPAIARYTWCRPYINRERIYQRTGPCATCGEITFDAYLTCHGEPRASDDALWTPYCRAHAPKLGIVDETVGVR